MKTMMKGSILALGLSALAATTALAQEAVALYRALGGPESVGADA